MSETFLQMADADPQVSHLMAYKQLRRFLIMAERLHREKKTVMLLTVFNIGGLSNVEEWRPPKQSPSQDWIVAAK